MLPVDDDNHPVDNYSKIGVAAKMRLLDTVVKVGDFFPKTPMVHYGDSRLLPESFRGATFENTSIEGLSLQGGRLHSMRQPNSSSLRDGFATLLCRQGRFALDRLLRRQLKPEQAPQLHLYSSRL